MHGRRRAGPPRPWGNIPFRRCARGQRVRGRPRPGRAPHRARRAGARHRDPDPRARRPDRPLLRRRAIARRWRRTTCRRWGTRGSCRWTAGSRPGATQLSRRPWLARPGPWPRYARRSSLRRLSPPAALLRPGRARRRRRRTATTSTGGGRCRGSAIRRRACSWSGWRRRRTAPTGPGASSPATAWAARATSCSARLHATGLRQHPDLAPRRRRPHAARRLHPVGGPLRAAREQTDARRDRALPAPPGRRARRAPPRPRRGGAGQDRPRRLPGPLAETHGVRPRPRPVFGHGSEARLGAGSRCCSAATTRADRTPTREAHAPYDAGRVRARPRAHRRKRRDMNDDDDRTQPYPTGAGRPSLDEAGVFADDPKPGGCSPA